MSRPIAAQSRGGRLVAGVVVVGLGASVLVARLLEGLLFGAAPADPVDRVKQSGHYLASEPLQPTETATTVRVRDGRRIVTDGPFAETKEQLGGFFLIESEDLDDAIDVAARIPGARTGTIEVRPVAGAGCTKGSTPCLEAREWMGPEARWM